TSITTPATASRTAAAGAPTRNATVISSTTAHWCTLRAVTSNSGSPRAWSLTFSATGEPASLFQTRRCHAAEPRVAAHLAKAGRVQQLQERGRDLGEPDTGGHDASNLRSSGQQSQRLLEVPELRIDAASDRDLAGDPEHRHQ